MKPLLTFPAEGTSSEPYVDTWYCHSRQEPIGLVLKNFRTRLQGASVAVIFTWFTGGYFVITYALAILVNQTRLSLVDGIVHLTGAAFFGGVMTALLEWQRRHNGGVGISAAIDKAMRSGIVPDDADPAIWGPALHRCRRRNGRAHWLLPLVCGIFAALGVWLTTQEPPNALPFVITAFFIVNGAAFLRQAPRNRRRI